MRPVGLTIAILLLSAGAHADEKPSRRWELDVRLGRVVLGDQRPTGGLMPTLGARHAWLLGERGDLSVGAQFGLFGLDGPSRWIGVLGGVSVGGSWRPWSGPIALGITCTIDAGRIPVCNNWGLCLRYIGVYPAGSASVTYYAPSLFAAGASIAVRHVSTLAWTGASVEPSLSARLFW